MRRLRLLRDIRTRLLVTMLATLGVAFAVSIYGFNAVLARSTAKNADLVLRQRAVSERAVIHVVNGTIRVSDTPDDTPADSRIWIFAGRTPLEVPRTSPETDRAARTLTRGPARYVDVSANDERLYSLPVTDGSGRRLGTIVAGLSVAPYELTRRVALTDSLVLALALLGALGVAVWWLLRLALRPVARMTEQAAAWSEHDLDRRFDFGEPHDELTRLAATLDGLLDRIAASLRHERRFSAEVSHELRTPLSKVIAEAELSLRHERDPTEYRAALEVVIRHARQVGRIIETLVTAAQAAATSALGTADAYEVARGVAENVGHLASARGVVITTEVPKQTLRIGVDADLAERALQPVVENACRYGRSRVSVTLTRRGQSILFEVLDDGPGVRDDEREVIFDPGRRGSAGRDTAGAGLGLALARRLARSTEGEIQAVPSAAGGSFVVSLPTA